MEKIVNHASEKSIEEIKQVIVQFKAHCPKMNLTEIKGDYCIGNRKAEYVLARQLQMYFLKIYTFASLDWIGKISGNKDHSTVLYSAKNINNHLETNKIFRAEFFRIRSKVIDVLKKQGENEQGELVREREMTEIARLAEISEAVEKTATYYNTILETKEAKITELSNEINKLRINNKIDLIEKLNQEIDRLNGMVLLLDKKLKHAKMRDSYTY